MALEPYLDIFRSFSWDVGSKNLNDIIYDDERTGQIGPLSQNPVVLQQFSQPLPIPALKIYFPYGDDISDAYFIMNYPHNMSILQILGAIHDYFQQPITLQEIQYADEPDAEWNVEIANRVRRGETVTRYELFEPDVFFRGLDPHQDGYTIEMNKK